MTEQAFHGGLFNLLRGPGASFFDASDRDVYRGRNNHAKFKYQTSNSLCIRFWGCTHNRGLVDTPQVCAYSVRLNTLHKNTVCQTPAMHTDTELSKIPYNYRDMTIECWSNPASKQSRLCKPAATSRFNRADYFLFILCLFYYFLLGSTEQIMRACSNI